MIGTLAEALITAYYSVQQAHPHPIRIATMPPQTHSPPSEMSEHVEAFISYARDNRGMFEGIQEQLSTLEDTFDITFRADESRHAGHHWNATIERTIKESDLFVPLVSPAYVGSRHIAEREIPAIRKRQEDVNGLVVPIVLETCGWHSLFGSLPAVPSQGRKLVPISQWPDPEKGYGRARDQVAEAVQRHFNLLPRPELTGYLLKDLRQERPGPIWVQRGTHFALDPTGRDGDMEIALDRLVVQLHSAIRQKSELFVISVARLGNDPIWRDLVQAARHLDEVIRRPTEWIPDHIATVWEISVRIASFLEQDQHIRATHTAEIEGLPANIHRELADLVGSLAPWLRQFPTARELDDVRMSFLTDSDLLNPAADVLAVAGQSQLVDAPSLDSLAANLRAGRRIGLQGKKSGSYAIRGARNLIIRSSNVVGEFVEQLTDLGQPEQRSLIRKVRGFLATAGTSVDTILHDYPADIRWALSHLVDENQDQQAAEELEAELIDLAGGLLSAQDVQRKLGSLGETRTIDASAAKLQLLAIGRNGEWLFPACQFEGSTVLEGISDILKAAPTTDSWRILQFLLGKADGLGGGRPIEMLRSGRANDRNRVIAVARTLED